MTRRALATTFGAGWLALLAMRLTVNAAGASAMPSLGQIAMVVGPITAIWIPIIITVLWIDRAAGLRDVRLGVPHSAFAIAVAFVEPWFAQQVLGSVGLARSYTMLFVGRLDTNLLIYALIIVAHRVILRLDAFRVREIAAARLEQALVDAQLHALAIQLQPHFLFNALQFVAESAHEDLKAARRTLGLLRGLVHQAFTLENRVEVTVAEELSFLRAYGDIQRSRFGDRFRLTIDADEAAMHAAIPPLLLQPLVENASRHGFASRSEGGHVSVSVRAKDSTLSIVVADDGAGLPARIREGQGLSVTRKRLERLHGEASGLALQRGTDGRTEARILLPFRGVETETPHLPNTSTDQTAVTTLTDSGRAIPIGARILLFWGGLMTLVIGATAIATAFGPRGAEYGTLLPSILFDEIVGLPFWAAITFMAVGGARKLRGPLAVPAHAVIAVSLALAHVFLGDDIARMLVGPSLSSFNYQQWATWDVLVYAAIVFIARSHDLREWLRAKAREEVTLNTQVVQATARLARLREMQAVLLASLDRVIDSPTMESLDRAVVEFADFLRGEVMPDAVGAAAGIGR